MPLNPVSFQLVVARWVGSDGRISALVTSDELSNASLLDFFTTDLAFRLNGRVASLFTFKLMVLAANLLLLFVGSKSVSARESQTQHERRLEKAFAMRFGRNGGLGLSPIYASADSQSAVIPYELVRAGYAVLPSVPFDRKPSKASVSSMRLGSLSGAVQRPTCFVVAIVDWLWIALFHLHGTRAWLPALRVSLLHAPPTPSSGLLRADDAPSVGRVGEDFGRLDPTRITACACE